jgi:hypothetical protein
MRPYLILTLLAVGAGSLRAQTPEIVKEVDANLNVLRAAQRNEDIEILRLLMNRSFGFTHKTEMKFEPTSWGSSTITIPYGGSMAPGSAATVFSNPYLPASTAPTRKPNQEVGPFDGLYLSGAGVVYTLRIPTGVEVSYDPFAQAVGLTGSCSKCHADVSSRNADHKVAANASTCTSCHTAGSLSGTVAADKPLTDWERARLELRGEKPSVAPAPVKPDAERAAVCQPGSVSEQLQRLLFAYGKNVGHLPATEKITVAITFDETPGAKPAPAAPTSRMGFTPEELQKLTLGDLHLKQQKHKEALAAYREGLVRFQTPDYYLQLPIGVKGVDAVKAVDELQTRVRQLYRAIAMAQLATQDVEGAKASLELAQNFKVAIVNQTPTAKTRLPAKLIVSVAAGDLAKAADYAAFQKLAKVELQNFPAAKAKPAK